MSLMISRARVGEQTKCKNRGAANLVPARSGGESRTYLSVSLFPDSMLTRKSITLGVRYSNPLVSPLYVARACNGMESAERPSAAEGQRNTYPRRLPRRIIAKHPARPVGVELFLYILPPIIPPVDDHTELLRLKPHPCSHIYVSTAPSYLNSRFLSCQIMSQIDVLGNLLDLRLADGPSRNRIYP